MDVVGCSWVDRRVEHRVGRACFHYIARFAVLGEEERAVLGDPRRLLPAGLPAAGYPVGQRGITTINGVVHAGINFSGHGYQPSSAIAIVGTTATLGFESGSSSGGGAAAPPAGGGGSGGAPISVEQPNVSQTLSCTGGNIVNILTGVSDDVTVHTGNPQVSKTRENDNIHFG